MSDIEVIAQPQVTTVEALSAETVASLEPENVTVAPVIETVTVQAGASEIVIVDAGQQGPEGPPGPQGDQGEPGSAYLPRIADLRGQIGPGVTLFAVPEAYLPELVELVWNGQPLIQQQGIIEIPPNQIQLEADTAGRLLAPKPGHGLYVRYYKA